MSDIDDFAEDTPLSKDLYEHLENRKEQRFKTLTTTENVGKFFLGWSLNSTGYFLSRFLLLAGGGTNLFFAATICFAIAGSAGFAAISTGNVSANYGQGGLQVEGGEALVTAATGLTMGTTVTFLSIKDFLYYQDITNQTVTEIKNDVQSLEAPSFWGTDWVFLPVVLLAGMVATKMFLGRSQG